MAKERTFTLSRGVKGREATFSGGASELEVAVGTTGPTGGNNSRSFFSLKETLCPGTTEVKVEDDALDFAVEFCGDSELRAMIQSLKFIVETLEASTKKHDAKCAQRKFAPRTPWDRGWKGIDSMRILFGKNAAIRAGIPAEDAKPLHWKIIDGEVVCTLWGVEKISEAPSRLNDCITYLSASIREGFSWVEDEEMW